MSIPRHYIDEAKRKLKEIDDWFSGAVAANPGNVLALVAQRAKKIDEQVYEKFHNQRWNDFESERDVNSLRLKCRAGRGRPFGSVPRSSSSGSVQRDNDDWIYDSHRVAEHSSNRGEHSVEINGSKTGCSFGVSCVGVSFENVQRGSGWHDATLFVTFRLNENAIREELNGERLSLQRELGL